MAHRRKGEERASHEACFQIGEVAERTGVTQRTLRFYEEKGLLKPPSRMDGGFRLYSEDDIQRVEQIKRLQQLLGFTLADIKEMVDAQETITEIRAQYRAEAAPAQKRAQLLRAREVTERQLDLVRQKVEALTDMQSKLDERLERIRGWLEGMEKAEKTKAKAAT